MQYNAADLLLEAGRPDKVAFMDPDRTISYEELADNANRFANLLGKMGIKREERIACILLDTVDYPAIILGAMKAGVIPVLINTLLMAEQYDYMVKDCRAVAVFVSPSLVPAIVGLKLSNVHIIDSDFEKTLHRESDRFETVPTSADEVAFWLYSSGSTGSPKGTKHVHSSLMATAELYGQGVIGIRETDVVFSAAKLFFAYGFGNGFTFPLSVGATTVLNPGRPTPALVFEFLDRYNPTIFYGVPTLYAAMLGDKSLEEAKGSENLRLCTSAGEALPAHIGEAFTKRFGVSILDGIGSTEMLHVFLSNTPQDVAYGTTGRAVKGYTIELRDDNGGLVAQGEIGELYVKGPSAAEGYWNQRAKSQATFQGAWTKSGDKYIQDANGRYTYCGRADDMFKVSGIWLSPFEVESALMTHASVLEAAVVPHEDAEKLLKPKAFVVLKEGASVTAAALKDHVKASIGLYKYPREIEFVAALPKTATGKIQRFKLRN
jgi:4-hydroxybenzoate-CoA ligase